LQWQINGYVCESWLILLRQRASCTRTRKPRGDTSLLNGVQPSTLSNASIITGFVSR